MSKYVGKFKRRTWREYLHVSHFETLPYNCAARDRRVKRANTFERGYSARVLLPPLSFILTRVEQRETSLKRRRAFKRIYVYIVSSLIVLSLMYKCKYDIYSIIISSIYKGSLFIKILKRIFIFCKLESYRIHNTIYQICVFISSNDIGKRRWGIELKSI